MAIMWSIREASGFQSSPLFFVTLDARFWRNMPNADFKSI